MVDMGDDAEVAYVWHNYDWNNPELFFS
jgi:hypothetical protein